MNEKEINTGKALNRKSFSDLFDSIAAVLCTRDQTPETIDGISFACRCFVEEAKNVNGKCLNIGIAIFSNLFGLPEAAVRAEVQKAKENK